MASDGTGGRSATQVRTDGGRTGRGPTDADGTTRSLATVARLGALSAVLLAVFVAVPAVLVTGVGSALGDFYTAGPFGLTAVGFLAVVAAVVFLSVTQSHTDTALVSGVAVVVSLATFLLAVVWVLTLDETLLFSFPSEYAWLATYRWVVVAAGAVVAAVGGLLASRVL
jgi:hypothetical protein